MLEILLGLCGSNNFPQWALQLAVLIVRISSSNTDVNVVFLNLVLHGFMVNIKRVSLFFSDGSHFLSVEIQRFTFLSFLPTISFPFISFFSPSHTSFLPPGFYFSLSFFHSVGEAGLELLMELMLSLELQQSSWLSLLLVGAATLEMWWWSAHSDQKSFCLKWRILCFTRISTSAYNFKTVDSLEKKGNKLYMSTF